MENLNERMGFNSMTAAEAELAAAEGKLTGARDLVFMFFC
jgi:hypothetical protein